MNLLVGFRSATLPARGDQAVATGGRHHSDHRLIPRTYPPLLSWPLGVNRNKGSKYKFSSHNGKYLNYFSY